jgi:hypothetical protein
VLSSRVRPISKILEVAERKGPVVTFIDTLPNKQADLLKGQAGGTGHGPTSDISPLIAHGPGKVVLVTEVTIE